MSADFWAGYLSGVVGIVVGNPLDIEKVRQQTARHASGKLYSQSSVAFMKGTAAPIFGYGALNALLFVSYNRTEAMLKAATSTRDAGWVTWTAGAMGGLAVWVVSAPTELIKCRAQMSTHATSSWTIFKQILRTDGVKASTMAGSSRRCGTASAMAFIFGHMNWLIAIGLLLQLLQGAMVTLLLRGARHQRCCCAVALQGLPLGPAFSRSTSSSRGFKQSSILHQFLRIVV
jgi:hypothetical protein